VGGLIGGSAGNLQSCYATGQVVADGNEAGGLVGSSCCDAGTITGCYATGAVRGRDRVGGLIGDGWLATVSQCCSRSDVTGREYVGGLIGMANQPVDSSYARGSVTGHKYVGGLIGRNWDAVVKCHSTGRVSGDQFSDGLYIRGLLGYQLSNQVESCFWDVETSRQTQGAQSGATGKTTAQMQMAVTFINAGWNFENIWTICEGRDYPRLRWEDVECSQ